MGVVPEDGPMTQFVVVANAQITVDQFLSRARTVINDNMNCIQDVANQLMRIPVLPRRRIQQGLTTAPQPATQYSATPGVWNDPFTGHWDTTMHDRLPPIHQVRPF